MTPEQLAAIRERAAEFSALEHIGRRLYALVGEDVPALLAEVERLTAELAKLNNAITRNTSCLACSTTLDASYAETVRAEKAEAERDESRAALASIHKLAQRSRNMHSRFAEIADTAKRVLSAPPNDSSAPSR